MILLLVRGTGEERSTDRESSIERETKQREREGKTDMWRGRRSLTATGPAALARHPPTFLLFVSAALSLASYSYYCLQTSLKLHAGTQHCCSAQLLLCSIRAADNLGMPSVPFSAAQIAWSLSLSRPSLATRATRHAGLIGISEYETPFVSRRSLFVVFVFVFVLVRVRRSDFGLKDYALHISSFALVRKSLPRVHLGSAVHVHSACL